jgi:hypothetical protein
MARNDRREIMAGFLRGRLGMRCRGWNVDSRGQEYRATSMMAQCFHPKKKSDADPFNFFYFSKSSKLSQNA